MVGYNSTEACVWNAGQEKYRYLHYVLERVVIRAYILNTFLILLRSYWFKGRARRLKAYATSAAKSVSHDQRDKYFAVWLDLTQSIYMHFIMPV